MKLRKKRATLKNIVYFVSLGVGLVIAIFVGWHQIEGAKAFADLVGIVNATFHTKFALPSVTLDKSDDRENALLSLEFAILTLLGTYNFAIIVSRYIDISDIDGIHNEIVDLYNRLGIQCELLTRKQLYERMCEILENYDFKGEKEPTRLGYDVHATSFLLINPSRAKLAAARRYHRLLVEMTKQGRLNTRRILSIATRENFEWVQSQIRAFAGNAGFSLRWHKSSSYNEENVGVPQSVQIIGDEHLFILHPRARYDIPPRDSELGLYIRSKRIADLFFSYYERLWSGCGNHEIINNGRVNDDVYQEIKRHVAHPWRHSGTTSLQASLLEIASNVHALTREELLRALGSLDYRQPLLSMNLTDPGVHHYSRKLVLSTEGAEVLLMNWKLDVSALPHDHGPSKSWIYVVEGQITNSDYNRKGLGLSLHYNVKTYKKGQLFMMEANHFHSLRTGNFRTVTLHINVPPVKTHLVYDARNKTFYRVSSDCGAWIPDKCQIMPEPAADVVGL